MVHLCADCNGTGADRKKTEARKLTDGSYVRCWTCNGNGLDPAEYFRWSDEKKKDAPKGSSEDPMSGTHPSARVG